MDEPKDEQKYVVVLITGELGSDEAKELATKIAPFSRDVACTNLAVIHEAPALVLRQIFQSIILCAMQSTNTKMETTPASSDEAKALVDMVNKSRKAGTN